MFYVEIKFCILKIKYFCVFFFISLKKSFSFFLFILRKIKGKEKIERIFLKMKMRKWGKLK